MDEFDLTQEQVADRVGKSRSAIANAVRLLRLPPRVIGALESGEITEGHARPLLALGSPELQLAMLDRILAEGLTSKDVERSSRPVDKVRKVRRTVVDATDPNWQALQEKASEVLGAPVALTGSEKGGTIVIRFFSEDDLVRLMDQLDVRL
jgi:ParB family chromosome partitioning protein